MASSSRQRVFLLDTLEFTAAVFQGAFHDTCPGVVLLGAHALAASPEASALGLDGPLQALAAKVDAGADTVALCEALARDHVRLFVSARGGIPAPPYESCHAPDGGGRTMGPEAQAMRERLAAFGLQSGAEPPDHLSVELGYLYFLFHLAWVDKEADQVEGAAFAAHMLPWCERFALAVHGADKGGYFDLSARLLLVLLRVLSTI